VVRGFEEEEEEATNQREEPANHSFHIRFPVEGSKQSMVHVQQSPEPIHSRSRSIRGHKHRANKK
jgi:hypothetical protein